MVSMVVMEAMITMGRQDTTLPVSKETQRKVLDALLEEQNESGERLTYDEFVLILLRRSSSCKKL